eukprot:scaffold1976_cov187-Alexandrium_tamarense.AAC.9
MEGDKSKGTPPPPPAPPPLPPSSQSPSSPFRKEYSPKGNLQFAAAGSRPPRPQIISQRAASGNNYYYTGSAQGQSTSSARQRTYSANNAYGNSPPRRESNQSLDSQQGTTFPVHLRQPSLSHESIGFGSSARSGARYGDQSDANLILASLERPALEDAAESTLMDVLERRNHVSFDTGGSSSGSRHRRHVTYAETLPADIIPPGVRPLSAPSGEHRQQPLERPSLINRAASLGRSKRNLLRGSDGEITHSFTTSSVDAGNLGDYLGVESGGGVLPSSSFGDGEFGNATAGSTGSSASSQKQQYVQETTGGSPRRPALGSFGRVPSFTSRRNIHGGRHQRARSAAPTNADVFSGGGLGSGVVSEMSQSSISGASTLRERAMHVAMTMKQADPSSGMDESNFMNEGGLSDLINLVEAKRENEENSHGGSPLAFGNDKGFTSNIDMLFQVAEHVQDLCQIPEEEEDERDEVLSSEILRDSMRSRGSLHSHALASENANFLSQIANSHPDIPEPSSGDDDNQQFGEAGVNEQTPMLEKATNRRRIHTLRSRQSISSGRFKRVRLFVNYLRRQLKLFYQALDTTFVRKQLWAFFQYQVSCIIVPALAVATFFYYRLGNPTTPFLPTDATISWWILFTIRSYLTLQLAHVTEYFFVDVMAMRSPFSIQLIGPLATLYILNAKGWPFILTCWGIWSFILIRGTGSFYDHWGFFTDIEMLNDDNQGGGVVESDLYTDVLTSLIVAGVATSIKRTILALYLGKRVYTHYKPKLEKVMVDMLLLTEVAELSSAMDDFEFEKVEAASTEPKQSTKKSSMESYNQAIRSSTMVDFVQSRTPKGAVQDATSDSDEDSTGRNDGMTAEEIRKAPWNRLRTLSNSSADDIGDDAKHNATKSPVDPEFAEVNPSHTDTGIGDDFVAEDLPAFVQTNPPEVLNAFVEELPALDDTEPPVASVHEPVQGLLRHQASTTIKLKSLLDRWEEPVNKLDKEQDPTIHEILQFRKALSFLDDSHPFGLSFGPAFTRETCIKSSKSLYKRLLGFNPDSPVLHFDVIGVLAYDAEGNFDEQKAKGLVRLFRPDKLLLVNQSHVLENIFNSVYFFFLGLVILSILHMSPWTLLMSLSTVMVSFAFALGPSAAKLIEGMMMIAIRRPFDLGDRISIGDAGDKPGEEDPGYRDTWIVEDCNLFTTTLRLTRTNELSSVNNGSLANCKIVNHGRSLNACVNLVLPMRIEVTHEQVQIVKSAIDQYVRDNPRVDPNIELIAYGIRVQHVKSWQDMLPILQARGDLQKFCTEIMMKLGESCCFVSFDIGIHFNNPAIVNDVFIKQFPLQISPEEVFAQPDQELND